MSDAKGLDAGLDEVAATEIESYDIHLLSDSKKKFKINSQYAAISYVLKVAMQDSKTVEIPVPGIDDKSVQLIVDWMNIRKGNDMQPIKIPIKFPEMKKVCHIDDADCAVFIERVSKNRSEFYKLQAGAYKLDIRGLINLSCAQLAVFLKFCKEEDIDRVLDPAITDGNLLPMRKHLIKSTSKTDEKKK